MEQINVVKLLKDCPSGMELDCVMYDNLYFDSLNADYDGTISCYTLIDGIKSSIDFSKYGTFNNHKGAKCVIFPKGKTTWEGFVPPCKFEDGDILTDDSSIFIFQKWVDNCTAARTYCALHNDGYFENGSILHFDIDSTKHATDAEKVKLFQVIKDNGYDWNPETKTLEKLVVPKFNVGDTITNGDVISVIKQITKDSYILDIKDCDICFNYVFFKDQDKWKLTPNKFDITTLKPFESRVLVRTDNRKWVAAFYSHYDKDASLHYCVVGGLWYEQCIPYDDNEHLLNTTNDCDDFYKTWVN